MSNILRAQLLKQWIDDNATLLSLSDRIKITLNIKGVSIVPEISIFPEGAKKK